MPVIINEFEVLAEEPERPVPNGQRKSEGNEQKQDECPKPNPPAPHDIVHVVRHWETRLARLRAY